MITCFQALALERLQAAIGGQWPPRLRVKVNTNPKVPGVGPAKESKPLCKYIGSFAALPEAPS
jgi:hypothetical protein